MDDGMGNIQITPEQIAKDRAAALERARLEIDHLDNDIADLLMQRMTKARYARYMHPEYVDDYDRELAVMRRYTKRLVPYVKTEVVADLVMCLFKMSRKP